MSVARLLTRMARAGFTDEAAPPPLPAGLAAEAPRESERLAILADLRRRIEKMERRPAPEAQSGPRIPPGPVYVGQRKAPLRLDELAGAERGADGVVVVTSRHGKDAVVGKAAVADALVASPDVAAPFAGLTGPAPRDLLHGLRILDIETTGLSGATGTLAFVVGTARFDGDGSLVVEQLVLGSPADEARFLARLARILDGATLLVTFNGRAFDAPLLRTRCVLARQAPGVLATAPHLDLLALARRLWRVRAGDCRLVTLEERVLGRRRVDDIPGALAPAAYRAFLESGDAAALWPIIDHNREDLVGTAALLGAALRIFEDPTEQAEDASELLAVGEHRLRLGDVDGALPLLERAAALARAPETLRRSLTQLARALRRTGRVDEARRAWERYRADFPRENLGYVEIAKLLEHRQRDPAAALAVVSQAPHAGADDVQRRLARLRERAARRKLPLLP